MNCSQTNVQTVSGVLPLALQFVFAWKGNTRALLRDYPNAERHWEARSTHYALCML